MICDYLFRNRGPKRYEKCDGANNDDVPLSWRYRSLINEPYFSNEEWTSLVSCWEPSWNKHIMRKNHCASSTLIGLTLLAVGRHLLVCNAAEHVDEDLRTVETSSRQLRSMCNGNVDEFLFDTFVDILGYREELECNKDEVADIGETLKAAYQNAINVNPRLSNVVDLLVNICNENPTVGVVHQSRRRKLDFVYGGQDFGLSWTGSGSVRWCAPKRNNLRRKLDDVAVATPTTERYQTNQTKKVEQRGLKTSKPLVGFKLWNTADEANPIFLRSFHHGDVLDLQRYGGKLTMEAIVDKEYSLEKVVFDFDDQSSIHTEWKAPYLLSGNDDSTFNTSAQLGILGMHTIRATPYSTNGTPLTPIAFAFLVVDSSTTVGGVSNPGSDEELINVLQDDLSYYLTGAVNQKFFMKDGHCLEGNLMYARVNLVADDDSQTLCPVDELEHHRPSSGQIFVPYLPGKCVDVHVGSTKDGAQVVPKDCDPSQLSQQWTFVPVDHKYYQIRASHSGKCMGIDEASVFTEGAVVVQNQCSTKRNMLWRIDWSGARQTLVTKTTRYCLEMTSTGTSFEQIKCQRGDSSRQSLSIASTIAYKGALATLAPSSAPTSAPTSGPSFRPTTPPTFRPTSTPTRAPTEAPTRAPTEAPTSKPSLKPTSPPSMSPTISPTSEAPTIKGEAGKIVAFFSGKCIDVESGSTADGASIVQNDCVTGRLSQEWTLVPMLIDDEDNTELYQIKASHSNKCIGVESASLSDDSNVVQLPCGSESHKLWQLVDAGLGIDDFFVAEHSNKCMGVDSQFARENGAKLQQNRCFGAVNQIFEIKVEMMN